MSIFRGSTRPTQGVNAVPFNKTISGTGELKICHGLGLLTPVSNLHKWTSRDEALV